MAGLLANHGFVVTSSDYASASVVVLNSCTVKGPSEQHFKNEIERANAARKHVVLAGCVTQSDRSYRSVASVIGVQQIDKIVEVVEETIRGNKIAYLSAKRHGRRSPGPSLRLPKIRKNQLIEIVPISTGCLNNCTYCKTKHARGQLASYPIESIVERIVQVCEQENIREIWLTSEDLGAWGIDLGHTIPRAPPRDSEGATPRLHAEAGNDEPPIHARPLGGDLEHPVPPERVRVPPHPGAVRLRLVLPRPGTAAAKLKRIPTHVVKARTKLLNELFLSYSNIHEHVVGTTQRVLVTETAHDGVKLVAHNKYYQQVLIDPSILGGRNVMGEWLDVRVQSFGKFSMVAGEVRYPVDWVKIITALLLVISCFIFFT
ncbi:Threonylcarbamoyladenosine tRNA methylthiotransferase [Orchesella cincta]|uniref:Threonylcarbamoyladenosine tRNA methylthiotransferase n=1 Tax=Orchesella cincta TaxID=48709 RepID=A0A1D2MDZ0_ORCCI|nr:Threonylcarbamoyladenosine tRNA methylthiotransferase [Orchesella cincta]